jgi:hypothetical protein
LQDSGLQCHLAKAELSRQHVAAQLRVQVPSDVSARFAAKLLAACQDTDYQVRIAAAQQLPVLALALGHAATVMQLLPELIELLADDEVQVSFWGLLER